MWDLWLLFFFKSEHKNTYFICAVHEKNQLFKCNVCDYNCYKKVRMYDQAWSWEEKHTHVLTRCLWKHVHEKKKSHECKGKKWRFILQQFMKVGHCLTLKEAGVVQKFPVGFRLAAISHRMMLWSQKFLTLSMYTLSRW